ncbi:MAG: tryptophan-rich sensory protein [Flavobacteriales bacterium]|nr:tryptophan-rich sensory protein [Flavobacteriales bacterium]
MALTPAIKILIAIVSTLVLGSLSGLLTIDAINGWYASLAKPSFNPPNWVFGPAWSVLYILMGLAAGLVWSANSDASLKRKALLSYIVQLGLNVVWTLIFFGLKSPAVALVEIIVLWVAIVWCIRLFLPISRPAAYLLVPYLLWVTFASVLNGAIVFLN